ncbi:MAG: hypothetical protein LBU58_01695, partial [Clostridiales bacterium]|nr:hypothetical protein [Clostridiales bacterium]
ASKYKYLSAFILLPSVFFGRDGEIILRENCVLHSVNEFALADFIFIKRAFVSHTCFLHYAPTCGVQQIMICPDSL